MMIVLLLCVIMKIAEFSVGRANPPLQEKTSSMPPLCSRRNGQQRKNYRWKSGTNFICAGQKCTGGSTMDDPQTPGSDCNSNPATDSMTQDPIGSEFIQDNVEYQWCIDYGYRDGGLHVHPSVLSSLSASYSRNDLGYYDDLARNLDANLAEMDMESFRTADIHTLLTALPVMCTDPIQHSEFNYQRERYASISGSVMEKLELGSSMSPPTSSQGEDSACSTTDTISICKSSLLFSPLKETPLLPAGGSYSVDSLDCEDMLLTCQTNNKNNYTIAFEGSITMYSDDSQDFENQEKLKTYNTPDAYYDEKVDLRNMLDLSMACSDSKIYTTWSNLKHSSMNKAIARHPSGNNNTIPNFLHNVCNGTLTLAKRSRSLPDLARTRDLPRLSAPLNFSVDSADSNILQHQQHLQNSASALSRSINEESSDSVGDNYSAGKKLQNLSLVRLFMKQKSMSAEGMSLTLDQSDSVSDGDWPTSHSGSGTDTNTNTNTNTNTQIDNRQNIKNSNNRQSRVNDFSINWLQTSYCDNCQEEKGQTDGIVNSSNVDGTIFPDSNDSNCRQDISTPVYSTFEKTKDDTMFSIGSFVGHTSESLQSNLFQTKNGNFPRRILSDRQSHISKTTGVQTIVDMEDDGVQTSMVYYDIPEQRGPSLRETIVGEKPVYVVYPNYVLPDLSFLNVNHIKPGNVALKPQCFADSKKGWKGEKINRPFSCNDMDALRQRGFSHVKDWESLTLLLPTEYKKILHGFPEVSKHIDINEETKKPLFCLSPPMRHRSRTVMTEMAPPNTVVSSASSTSTQPSSGYRGSSTILTDWSTNQQQQHNHTINPLYLYRYTDSISPDTSVLKSEENKSSQRLCSGPTLPKRSISLPHGEQQEPLHYNSTRVPPRPPLPRSILRKHRGSCSKRYSMFEMRGVEEIDDPSSESNKRMSLQEPYFMNNDMRLFNHGTIYDSEKDIDETEAKLTVNGGLEIDTYAGRREEDVRQLEEFLKRSAFSSESSDTDTDITDPDVKLRSYVRKFLSLRMNKDVSRNMFTDTMDLQRKTVSFAVHQSEAEDSTNRSLLENDGEIAESESRIVTSFEEKRIMIRCVVRAVSLLIDYFDGKTTMEVSDSNTIIPDGAGANIIASTAAGTTTAAATARERERNVCAQICLGTLCPALYAIMSDGLKPHLNSTFGPIANSVWQVVEASSQQGPLTKTLNELVRKINGEDVITEGMLKFNAFVFGLLNLRALDAWFAYLCTRESILRKHYSASSLFVGALADTNARGLLDKFLLILNRLELYPFQLDLLYQYRQLRNSFGNVNNRAFGTANGRHIDRSSKEQTNISKAIVSPKRGRPRSCIVYDDLADTCCDIPQRQVKEASIKSHCTADKWREDEREDYTDSLEHSPVKRGMRRRVTTNNIIDVKGFGAESKSTNEKTAGERQEVREKPETERQEEEAIVTTTSGAKFRKLQEKWELGMIGKDETVVKQQSPSSPARTPLSSAKSKIPRLLTSPVKHNNGPLTNATSLLPGKIAKSPMASIPIGKKPLAKNAIPKKSAEHSFHKGGSKDAAIKRTSRLDQESVAEKTPRTHPARPSSLPYKSQTVTARERNLASPQRRAASTSLPRPTTTIGGLPTKRSPSVKQTVKEVRTLTHRAPADNGHLSFTEGEKLKVILEVDSKWLLCARGDRKGLVPRSCVHTLQT